MREVSLLQQNIQQLNLLYLVSQADSLQMNRVLPPPKEPFYDAALTDRQLTNQQHHASQ